MPKSGERRRTIVYSNVNKKKADNKSASNNKDVIDLDDEIVIGLVKQPELKNSKEKKNKKKPKNTYKGNDDLKALWESEKEELEEEENKKVSKNKFIKKINKINKKIKRNLNKQQEKKPNKTELTTKNKPQKFQNNNVQAQSPKQLSIQERIKIQKRKIIKKITMIALLIGILLAGFVFFLLSPAFNIKKINVLNNSNISTQAIVNLSGIHINENMFKFSKSEVKKKILANPYIEEVKIKRKLFNNIEISVKEREATLMLEYGNSYVYINNQGYILEISTQKLNVPTLTGYVTPLDQVKPGNRLNREDLERLKTVLSIMEIASSNDLASLITKIDIKSKKDFILTLEAEDKIVYLGECADLSTQMLYIRKMIEKEKGIEGEFFINMDLNSSNPVFREKV